jgi:hypothetical protein
MCSCENNIQGIVKYVTITELACMENGLTWHVIIQLLKVIIGFLMGKLKYA